MGRLTVAEVWDGSEDPTVDVEYLGFAYVPRRVTVRKKIDFRICEMA